MPYEINPFTGELTVVSDPLPEGSAGQVLVVTSTGDFEWTEPATAVGSGVLSAPPTDGLRVTNIYVSSITGKTVVEFDDSASGSATSILSNPPQGHYRVTNIYVNPNNNRTVVNYDDTPQP